MNDQTPRRGVRDRLAAARSAVAGRTFGVPALAGAALVGVLAGGLGSGALHLLTHDEHQRDGSWRGSTTGRIDRDDLGRELNRDFSQDLGQDFSRDFSRDFGEPFDGDDTWTGWIQPTAPPQQETHGVRT